MGEKIWYLISVCIVIISGNMFEMDSESIMIGVIAISALTLLDKLI